MSITPRRPRRASARMTRRSQFLRRLNFEAIEQRLLLAASPLELNVAAQFTNGSNPSNMLVIGSEAYFAANDGVHGVELWASNGTSAGTHLVRDINPGAGDSSPASLTNVDGTLFFVANDGSSPTELWRSDGTSGGTQLVVTDTSASIFSSLENLTNVNGELYFSDDTSVWKSDGTSSGSSIVITIDSGNETAYLSNFTNLNGQLLFSAQDGIHGNELWSSNGTSSGTALVSDIVPATGGSYPSQLTVDAGKAYFFANDQLWTTNGTSSGTTLVAGVSGNYMIDVAGELYFTTRDSSGGEELWKSDGTSSGTQLVTDLAAGTGDFQNLNLVAVGNTVYFTPNDGSHGLELWKSTEGSSSAQFVANLQPAVVTAYAGDLTNAGGSLWFIATDAEGQIELYTSDGTTSGTKPLYSGNSLVAEPRALVDLGGAPLFAATDGIHGIEPWTVTAGSAQLVDDINTTRPSTLTFSNLVNSSGQVYFGVVAGTGSSDAGALFSSDGTVAGTHQVAPYAVSTLVNAAGTLYYQSIDPNPSSIISSASIDVGYIDGSSTLHPVWETAVITPAPYGSATFASVSQLTAVGSQLAFDANYVDGGEGFDGYNLMWLNQTSATTLVAGNGYPTPPKPDDLTAVGNELYFSYTSSSDTAGIELWKTDGTTSGTMLVRDINPGTANSSPAFLTNVNGTLYFSASDGTRGDELWKSYGTSDSTITIADIFAGSNSSTPSNLTNVNGKLFFSAYDGVHGVELWTSDGTSGGTVMVRDIVPGGDSSYPTNLANIAGKLDFTVVASGQVQLWTSDGTSSGTTLVTNLFPASGHSLPNDFTAVGNTLYFVADDGTHGAQIWQSDGTSSGTGMVAGVNATGSASPANLINFGGALFFTATGSDGLENPWVLASNVPPSLSIASTPLKYIAGSQALAVDPLLTDGGTIISATVSIGSGFTAGEDSLSFIAQPGISGSYNAASGVLTFSGSASAASYQALLRSVAFTDSAATPTGSTRTINFTLSGGPAGTASGSRTVDLLVATDSQTLTISGTGNDNIGITFSSSTSFTVNINGTATSYDTSTIEKVVFTGTGSSEILVFDDSTNPYTATAGLGSFHLNSSGFVFDATKVTTGYAYTNLPSTAQANDTAGPGFFVGVASPPYSYLADPIAHIYTEIASFGTVVAAGQGGSNYAYLYSASHDLFVGNPTQSTLEGSNVDIRASGYPQVYGVGASDGSDMATLDASGGKFVGTPLFSYVTDQQGNSNTFTFFIGALYMATVNAQASTSGTDAAYFYSYSGNAFSGAVGTSTLSGSNAIFNKFVTQASGFESVTVWASGSGTDEAMLTAPDGGTFVGTSTYSTMTAGSTTIEVVGYSQVSAVGTAKATAYLYDAPGSNTLVADGDGAELTTPAGSYTVNGFGTVVAEATFGTSDVKNVQAIDFTLSTIGIWTTG